MSEPITNVEAAVRELGALPVPTGAVDPVAAGRRLDLLALMDEHAASKVSPVLAAVLDEVEQWRATYGRDALPGALARLDHADFLERTTLPELRREIEHHKEGKARWRARAEDAEARVAELEAQREADHKTWQHDLAEARSEREATAVRIAGLEAVVAEDPNGLHHTYRLGRDLPELGGAR